MNCVQPQAAVRLEALLGFSKSILRPHLLSKVKIYLFHKLDIHANDPWCEVCVV